MAIRGPSLVLTLPAALRMLRDPRRFLAHSARRYGPTFAMRVPDRGRLVPLIFLLGPDANERILAPAHSGDFSWYEGYRLTMEPIFGRDILFLLDGEPHRKRHKQLLWGLHSNLDGEYFTAIERIAATYLDRWPAREGEVDLDAEIKRITLHVVAHVLLGTPDEDVPVVARDVDELGYGLFSIFQVDLPGFRFRRGLIARRKLAEYLRGRIAVERIAANGRAEPGANMLGALLRVGRSGVEEPLADETLIAELLAFLFAGYDTTASMQTSLWAAMLARPDVLERVTDEARSVRPASLGEQPWLEATMLETERLFPPLTFAMRGLTRDIEFRGHTLRAGWRVAYSPWFTGRMPELFPEPEAFQPERFVGKRPAPWTVLGFGGGHRVCIGKRFAQNDMRLVINAILRRFRVEPVPHQPDDVYFNPTLQRRHGFRVRVTRR